MRNKIIGLLSFVAVISSFVLAPISATQAQVSIDYPSMNTNTHKPTVTTVDLVCMQNAVDKRDTAIMSALDTYTAAAKTALQTRKDELKAGWALTDVKARNAALKAAWKKYRDAIRVARKTFRDAKRADWRQFTTDRKACRSTASSDDSAGQGVDETL